MDVAYDQCSDTTNHTYAQGKLHENHTDASVLSFVLSFLFALRGERYAHLLISSRFRDSTDIFCSLLGCAIRLRAR